ncbi:Fic/DOC family protein [Microbacterium aurum]
MPDRYTYPGSDVLVNKFGVTDYDDWKDAEADFIGARMGALREQPITGSYDLAHLQAIHAYLTQDMYSWGGEIRDTDTHPGGTGIAHCRPQFIVPEAERVSSASSPGATTCAAWMRTSSLRGWPGCGARRPRSTRSAT